MQSILSILVVRRYIRTKSDGQLATPSILRVFLRDHIWAFLLIFSKSWIILYVFTDSCEYTVAVSLWATLAYTLTDHLGEVALT